LQNIAIIGSGNAATYLGHLFLNNGFNITTVISRNSSTGMALAKSMHTGFSEIPEIPPGTGLVVLCVNDDEIKSVSNSLPKGDYAVCHCAGSMPLSMLDRHDSRAVMYPLQSINADTDALHAEVPFLIEADNNELLLAIEKLLHGCGKASHRVDSDKRLAYHLAAVFANNFTNAMLLASEGISKDSGLDFSLLKPLIGHTFKRLDRHSPEEVQTGPAKRNDKISMGRHIELLSAHPDMKALYVAVSDFIRERFKKK
jgi:predicted short-subunit dehydrogenase-like oxidoreductase (DUF2520 family)